MAVQEIKYIMNENKYNFSYKGFQCVAKHEKGDKKPFVGFMPSAFIIKKGDLVRSQAFIKNRCFESLDVCKAFVEWQIKKFIDNNLVFNEEEFAEEYYLEINSLMPEEERKKAFDFYKHTHEKLNAQLLKLESSSNKEDFSSALTYVRDRLIKYRNGIAIQNDDFDLSDKDGSENYLTYISSKKETELQYQMQKIDYIFKKKFGKSVWDEYRNRKEYKTDGKTKNEISKDKAEKILKNGKEVMSRVFGIIAFIWFIVMLPSQSDFESIVIGWVVIGVIYLIFKGSIHFK